MAITYNTLYLDIRQQFLRAGLPDPTLVHGPDFQGGPPTGGPEGGPGGPGGPAGGPPPAVEKPHVELKDHGTPPEHFFEGEILFDFEPQPDGTLKGTADGTPINFGYYTGDEFFKVEYPAGPGCWEVWARVDKDGYIEGMISVGGGKGFPNLVYGRKVEA